MIPCVHTNCIHNKDACCCMEKISMVTNSTENDIKCLYYEEIKKKEKTLKLPSAL